MDCSAGGEGIEPKDVDLGPNPLGLRISSIDETGEEVRLSVSPFRGRPMAMFSTPAPKDCRFFLEENMLETRSMSCLPERLFPFPFPFPLPLTFTLLRLLF